MGNRDLAPQYVNTFEFQLAYEPAARLISLSTDVAYSLLNDKTEFVQQGINKVARNVARAATLSWESRVELRYPTGCAPTLSLELQRTDAAHRARRATSAQLIGDRGQHLPAGDGPQRPGDPAVGIWPLRAAVLASYIGTRRASGNNILLNGGAYDLPGLRAAGRHAGHRGLPGAARSAQQVGSFSVSGKNLLGATGPTPGFAGVDYPLAPRALFLQMDLTL